MKQTILSLLLIAALSSNAQQKDYKKEAQSAQQATAKKDSVDVNIIPLFSLNDLNDLFVQVVNIMPDNYKTAIDAWVRQRLQLKLQPKK